MMETKFVEMIMETLFVFGEKSGGGDVVHGFFGWRVWVWAERDILNCKVWFSVLKVEV